MTVSLPQRLAHHISGERLEIGQERTWIFGASLLGIASMAATSLLQVGAIKDLPDPPLPGFNTKQVNLSKSAFPLGIPDSTLAVLSFAMNVPLAAYGGRDRARTRPWFTLLAGAKAAADAAVATWFFLKMPLQEKAWCAYCITAAAMNWAVLAASLPEVRQAVGTLRR